MRGIFQKGKDFFYARQSTILSAAATVMIMVAASRSLGLVRNRIFVHFFAPHELDTYLAAFQLPDLIFEVLVLGAMSSAFIPVFARGLSQKREKEAWQLAGLTLNVLLLIFLIVSFVIFSFAHPFYSLVVRGFDEGQVSQTVLFTRVLLVAQLFFVVSYVFTAVLESNQRFLAPAIAPLFYNVGIIAATVLFAPSLGLFAPVWGAVVGSFLHLLVQAPLALTLGFRPVFSLNFRDADLVKVTKLALPRILELSSFQFKRLVDLFLASLVAGGITYFKFAESVAVLPVSLFGLSIAKASLPQLSAQGGEKDTESFKSTFVASFRQILFFVVPASVFLGILRIPIVRLAFGGAQFDWEDTVQTGYVLSAFAIGVAAYALSLLIARAFYALHDTTTPVKISFATILVNICLGLVFVLYLGLPIWALALSYSISGIFQFALLFGLLTKKAAGFASYGLSEVFAKVLTGGVVSGVVMFVLLKGLDRSAWDKKLSFLGKLGLGLPTTFDKFVLDTRYTTNLIVLTLLVGLVGLFVYLLVTWLLGVRELGVVVQAVRRISLRGPLFGRGKRETVSPPHVNGD